MASSPRAAPARRAACIGRVCPTTSLNPPPGLSVDFLVHSYKVEPCLKRFPHDWAACLGAHKNERAARRCPVAVGYDSVACPYAKKRAPCPDGDACRMSHTLYEYWMHPQRFRTEMCQLGEACSRTVCFFAHSKDELRPLDPSVPPSELCWGTQAAHRAATMQRAAKQCSPASPAPAPAPVPVTVADATLMRMMSLSPTPSDESIATLQGASLPSLSPASSASSAALNAALLRLGGVDGGILLLPSPPGLDAGASSYGAALQLAGHQMLLPGLSASDALLAPGYSHMTLPAPTSSADNSDALAAIEASMRITMAQFAAAGVRMSPLSSNDGSLLPATASAPPVQAVPGAAEACMLDPSALALGPTVHSAVVHNVCVDARAAATLGRSLSDPEAWLQTLEAPLTSLLTTQHELQRAQVAATEEQIKLHLAAVSELQQRLQLQVLGY